jgi:GTP-binding protein
MKYETAQFLASYGLLSQIPECSCPEIVFSGRSNVGKSSLINRVFSRKNLARTGNKPGKTITINFYGADGVHFVDLPGYGFSKTSKSEKQRFSGMIEGYFSQDRDIRLVVQLVDMRHEPSDDDIMMMDYLCSRKIPFAVIMTKSDKLNKTDFALCEKNINEKVKRYAPVAVTAFSALNGSGTEQIRKIIEQHL